MPHKKISDEALALAELDRLRHLATIDQLMQPEPKEVLITSTKILDVPKKHHGTYTRTIEAQWVTFTCEWCGHERTIAHFPGPAPRYCPGECYSEAQKSLNRQRVKAHRQRQATAKT